MKFSQLAIRSLYILLFATLGYSCAVNPVTGKKEISFMSEEKELAMGKQYDPSIVASFGLYENEELQAFINEKGMEMAKISHRPHLPYEFKILDSPVINAFAVPGGYVYFTRGILAHFNNEAEFAGVLGHEIGHVTARHSARSQTKQILGQVGLMAGMILSPAARELAQPLSQGLQFLMLKNSREHESESDKLGVEYSTAVGYDAHHMANFFNTLKRKQEDAGVSIPEFQSTHPDPGNRFNRVHAMAEATQAEKGGTYTVNRDKYLKMIDGLIFGEDPQQGYVEDDYFYHPGLKFKFPIPRGWRTANSPQQFQMADKDGKAMMVLLPSQSKTGQEAAQAFNEKQQLRVLNAQPTNVNGLRAYAQVAEPAPAQQGQQQQQQQQQQKVRILSYFIEYNGLIYEIHGVSEVANYANLERTFLYTMQGFNILRDPSKINRKPDRIKIVNVQRTGTLSSILQSYRMPNDKMDELSLINGMQLNDQVQAGSLIKIVAYDSMNRGGTVNTAPANNRSNQQQPAPVNPVPTNTNTNNTTNTQPAPSSNQGGHLPPPPRTSTPNSNTTTTTKPTGTKKLPGRVKKKN